MYIQVNRLPLLGFAFVFILAGAIPSASAQDNRSLQFSSAQAGTISDGKIAAYATSAVKITRIHDRMAPRIKSAATKDEKDRMIEAMQKEMLGAINETDGITIEEYNEISRRARHNPQLADRLLNEVRARL